MESQQEDFGPDSTEAAQPAEVLTKKMHYGSYSEALFHKLLDLVAIAYGILKDSIEQTSTWSGLNGWIVTLIFATVTWIIVKWIASIGPHKKLPGPVGLPILGYLPFLDRRFSYLTFEKLAQRYGPIYQVKLGSVNTVILSSAEMIKTAFKQDLFNGRPPLYVTTGMMQGYGLLSAYGMRWKDQRRFSVNCLKTFGVSKSREGRAKLEDRIMSEIEIFMQELTSQGREAFDPSIIVRKIICNLMSGIIFGERYELNDVDFTRELNKTEVGLKAIMFIGTLNFLPWLRFIPFFAKHLKQIMDSKEEHHVFLQKYINSHTAKFPEYDNIEPSDLIEGFLLERRKRLGTSDFYDDTQLRHLLADMLGAGTHTTSQTIKWALVYLIKHPEVQRRAQEELDSVIGREENPTLFYQSRTPYMEALILETQRLSNVVAMGMPHGTSENGMLAEYFIPKGTLVFGLLSRVHTDPEVWVEPEKFNPERFFDQDGKVVKPPNFMPFSVGRRSCPGEELASTASYLILATLLHRFNVTKPEGDPEPGSNAEFTLNMVPGHFRICLEPRA